MKLLMTATVAAIAAASAAIPASAATCTPLAQVARTDGYHYDYIGSQDAVALSKGSLTILVRPGDPLYDVGDRSMSVDGPVPESRAGDICISRALVVRFHELAGQTAAMTIPAVMRPKIRPEPIVMQPLNPEPPMRISALTLAQADGSQAIDISGHATPNSLVNLTLSVILSQDVPRVTVSRKEAFADGDGHFSTRMSVASEFYTHALLEVNAVPSVSAADFKPTRATIVMKPIFEKINLPSDNNEAK